MSGSGPSSLISAYAPATGIISDFENLFRQFEALKSVRYTHFLQVWKQMQMSFIFAGRQTDRECREFTEECLKLALAYCLDPSLQVRIFGLYLIYGLYFKYPFIPRVKVRVTSTDWKELMNLLDEITKQEHLDAEYVFLKLLHARAFHFVSAISECMPSQRSSSTEASSAENQHHKLEMLAQQKSIISELFESDTIDQLAVIHEEYHRVKCALAGPNASQPSVSLNIIDNGLIHTLTKFVTSHEEWRKTRIGKKVSSRRRRDSGGHTTSESESEVDQEVQTKTSSSHGALRAEIKDRAFSTSGMTVSSRRYRKPVVDEGHVSDASPVKSGSKRIVLDISNSHQLDEETVKEDSEAESASQFVFSMPCLMTGNAGKQEGLKNNIRNERGITDGSGLSQKKRGRPKQAKKTVDYANASLAVIGNSNKNAEQNLRRQREKDHTAEKTSAGKLGSTAKSKKKKRKSKQVLDDENIQHVEKDDNSSAADDVVIERVEKKRRRSKKCLNNSVFDQNSDDMQVLDITVDEHGSVHVHFTDDQLQQDDCVFVTCGEKKVSSKKVKLGREDEHEGAESFSSNSSPAKKKQHRRTSLPAKQKRQRKKNTSNDLVDVSFENVDTFGERDAGHRSESEVVTLTQLSSSVTKKRGRRENSLNSSGELSSREVLPDSIKAQGSTQLSSPSHSTLRKKGGLKKRKAT